MSGGASNMTSIYTGVLIKIRAEECKAIATYCQGDSLSFASWSSIFQNEKKCWLK